MIISIILVLVGFFNIIVSCMRADAVRNRDDREEEEGEYEYDEEDEIDTEYQNYGTIPDQKQE